MLSVMRDDRSRDAWIAAAWKQEWEASGPTRVHRHVSDPGEGVKEEDLSRKHWTTLPREAFYPCSNYARRLNHSHFNHCMSIVR